MNTSVRKSIGIPVALALLLLAGCGRGGGGTVSGTVTLDGKPLPKGLIRFVPVDGKGQPADASIVEGTFNARVPPGEVKVEIMAPKVTGKRKMYDTPDAPEVENVVELLPPRYNVRTELKMTVTRGNQQQTFELKSK